MLPYRMIGDLMRRFLCKVSNPENVTIGKGGCRSYGCFLQSVGKITIGDDVWIGPNVGIITANHDFNNLSQNATPKPVTIGDHCWIGMNAMVLPGVTLGEWTMVGAGAVVTKSFPKGHCVIAGNPAKFIRTLEAKEQ